MKQPKKLTRAHKIAVSAHNLNANNWSIIEETEFYLKIIHKQTGKTRKIDKFRR